MGWMPSATVEPSALCSVPAVTGGPRQKLLHIADFPEIECAGVAAPIER